MSTEKPSKRVRADRVVRSFEGRFPDSSLTSMPLPLMAVNSNRKNDKGASNLVLETTPIVDAHHTPHNHKPYIMSPPVSVPVSASSIPSVDSASSVH